VVIKEYGALHYSLTNGATKHVCTAREARRDSSFKNAGKILEALKEVIRKEVLAIASEIDLNFMDNYPSV